MKTITAIIVEDEEPGIITLQEKLARNCPLVSIIGLCRNAYEAIEMIPAKKPDLVFLDINLGNLNGFDVLAHLEHFESEVIFTTSYNQYAIRAIRQNALDYLLKPIEDKELANAVLKAYDRLQKRPNQPSHKVAIPVTNGYRFLSVDEILYCEADDNRTIVHLYSNKTIRTSRTLKKVEELLAAYKFVRIHRAFLINRDYLEEYSRIDGGYVIMSNGKRLPVSRKNLNLS